MEVQSNSRALPPAGWYQDPEGPMQRYWDGAQWHPPQIEEPQLDVLAVAALAFSIVGGIFISVVLAIVSLVRIRRGTRRGKGFAIAALSVSGGWVVIFVVAAMIISLTNDNNDSYSVGGTGGTDYVEPEQAAVEASATEFADHVNDREYESACDSVTDEFNQRKMEPVGQPCELWLSRLMGIGHYAYLEGTVVKNERDGTTTAIVNSDQKFVELSFIHTGHMWMIDKIKVVT